MNFLLKRIQRLPTKLQVFANFSPQKMLQPFIAPPPPHTLHIYLHQTIFYFQVEYEVKRTPPCGCCWDPRSRNWWIKEGPKRGILSSVSETYDRAKSCIYANGAYFEFKKMYVSSLCVFDLKQKSVLKLLNRAVYFCQNKNNNKNTERNLFSITVCFI